MSNVKISLTNHFRTKGFWPNCMILTQVLFLIGSISVIYILVGKIKTLTYATYLHGLHFSGEKGPIASGHLTCNLIKQGF